MKRLAFLLLAVAFAVPAHAGVFFPRAVFDKNGTCLTLATTAVTRFCVVSGDATASSGTGVEQEITAVNATITAFYTQIGAASGAGNSHAFTLVVNGSTTAATCTISGASATTCSITGLSIPITAGQAWYIQDVTTGTPAAANGYLAIAGTIQQ